MVCKKSIIDLDVLEATQTMGELNIDQKMLDAVLQAVSSPKEKSTSTALQEQTTTLHGKGVFKKYAPKSFVQVAESEDGAIAITIETREWEMRGQQGTSTKIHVRSKYLDNKGQLVYGFDIASFKDAETVKRVTNLLQEVLPTLK